MSSSKGVPDAWDDDWVDSQASSSKLAEDEAPPKKLTKAERRRQQYEFNKKLWEEAEAPEIPYYVQKANDVPLQSGFAPQMKLLSRRPEPVAFAKKDAVPGMQNLSLEDDEDDEEEQERKATELAATERAEKAKKEREEKQRRYDEVRQRLFGTSGADTLTPSSRGGSRGGGAYSHAPSERGSRGRGRGSGSGVFTRNNPGRQLYDPNSPLRAESASSSGTSTPAEGMPIRVPKGPDGSGRGGRGFVNRGARGTNA